MGEINVHCRECVVCRSRKGAMVRYRFWPSGRPQWTAYVHPRCLEELRKGNGAYDMFASIRQLGNQEERHE